MKGRKVGFCGREYMPESHLQGGIWHFDFRDAFLTRLHTGGAGSEVGLALGRKLKVFRCLKILFPG